ncbi:MAG: chalcone isomerase family protein [Polaromonas sp.]|nr:chalcone isomerase family protein [Polaromonas sp.]MDP3752819.1 chalcone isomerase family protein [Polaromonas sp.]
MSARLLLALLLGAGMMPAAVAQAVGTSSVSSAADSGEQRAELQTLLPQGRLVGSGRLTFWGFQVYDARLWAPPGFKPESFGTQTLALELSYLRAFSASDVAERSISEMRRSATISAEQADKWKAALRQVLPDVNKGDRVMGVHRPGVGASFLMNGKAIGEIRDAEFARLFFGIWLSPKTSEPALRNALLAGAGA